MKIRQGNQEAFENYLSRFNQLARYSTHSKEEKWLTRRLMRGLNDGMREKLAPMMLENWNRAVDVCRVTESS